MILDVFAALTLGWVHLIVGDVICGVVIAVFRNGAMITVAIAGSIRIIFVRIIAFFFIYEEGYGQKRVLILQQVVLD